ncbi:MAG: hypothetical protein V4582_05560 [Pseudomonadota bacterium]
MSRARLILGYVGAAILIASSAMHSLLGWPAAAASLAKAQVPADLVLGLALGWHFGGVAMLVLGTIVILQLRRGLDGAAMANRVIGAAYVLFGSAGLVASVFDPFMLIFIVPGVLLLASSWPQRSPT